LTLLNGARIILFALAVSCVGIAFATSRARCVSDEPGCEPWWRGRRRSVKPAVGLGWGLFVLPNVLHGFVQPVLAASLFVRAYVLRAACLRRRR
jgi:hypothetical protein